MKAAKASPDLIEFTATMISYLIIVREESFKDGVRTDTFVFLPSPFCYFSELHQFQAHTEGDEMVARSTYGDKRQVESSSIILQES